MGDYNFNVNLADVLKPQYQTGYEQLLNALRGENYYNTNFFEGVVNGIAEAEQKNPETPSETQKQATQAEKIARNQQEQAQKLNDIGWTPNRTAPIGGIVENPVTPNTYRGMVEYNPTQKYASQIQLWRALTDDKQNYVAAQNAYNELEKQLPNLTGDAKTQAEQQMSAFQKAMNDAQHRAEKHREYGGMFGINTDLFGSNVSLQDAQIALEDMASNAKNNLLYGNQFRRTADQLFEDEYQNYRQQGRSDREATILAGRKAAKYQAQRTAALNQGLNLFGFDGENRLNKFGVQMLQEIAKENPADVSMYGNFANPKNQFDNDFEVSMANLAHTLGVDMRTIENMLGMERDTHQSGLRINEANNAYQNSAKLKQLDYENQSRLDAQRYKADLEKIDRQMSLASEQEQEEYTKAVQRGIEAGLTPAEAKVRAYNAKYGDGKGKGEEKLSGEDNAIAGILTSSHNKYLNGDFDGALQPLYELKALIDDPESDYSKKASQYAKAALTSKIAEIENAKAQALKNNNNPTNNNSSTPPEKTTTNNRGGYSKDDSEEFEDSLGRKVIVPKNSNNESNDTSLNDSAVAKEAVKKAGGLTGYNNFRRVN